MNIVLRFLLATTLLVATVGTILYMAAAALDRSELHESWASKQCVRIVKVDGTVLPCSEYDADESYIHVWVP